ncbi:diguanylate cyclase (GGDEF)-like protein [Desulfobotulus alkaliphilus]|uniref:diguanylate cyclase n=1 Tax=Desulfobotulus alkaliphilus TaxID=622671 RepID=A0A562R8W1_9BACT|nr:GGDEF domain-containing protein [Desulfobotulus alkaliphilus]TWI64836.1 diguanylate cyclase (GGDEF)-like protein [Desulfobotulus alkaliphilus]
MENREYRELLELISKACISSLREMAEKKISLSSDGLRDMLLSQNLLASESFLKIVAAEKEGLEELQARHERLRQQKDTLLKDYTALEEKSQTADRFYRRTLLLFAEMQKNVCSPELNTASDRFRKLVRENAGIAILEKSFVELKDAAFRAAGACEDEGKPKKGIFGRFFKDSRQDTSLLFETLRESFQEITNNLRLNLDTGSVERIRKINEDLRDAGSLDDFLIIRRDIIDIVADYVAAMHDEREAAAGVIREIAGRLEQMEKLVLSAFMEQMTADATSNREFSATLAGQLEDLDQKASFSKTLEELKDAVVSRLNVIQQVLTRKQSEDEKRKEEADTRYRTMQQGLFKMRDEMIRVNEKSKILEEELLRDPLTGAYNRRAYDRHVAEEMDRFRRYGSLFSLLIFDVDRFKNVNDVYGHAVGDKCLKAIIDKVKPVLRASDFLARFGGEEFIVLLPETGPEGAREAGEKIRMAVETIAFYHKEDKVQITVSVGGGTVQEKDASYDVFFSRVDKALYEAKNSGRNRVVLAEV